MNTEPVIAVGLIEHIPEITLDLIDTFASSGGTLCDPGRYRFCLHRGEISCSSMPDLQGTALTLRGAQPSSRFRLQITIGIDFHWEQKQEYTFSGDIRLLPHGDTGITVINDVPLETYIQSVSSSEMNATSPAEFLKAHSIISRSWLLAQIATKNQTASASRRSDAGTIIRWYDREAHTAFDVCADDHCQRYQGIDRIQAGTLSEAVASTRGLVLMHNSRPCDARFSKCCGGVTEDFRLAWDDTPHPYLIPLADTEDERLPDPPLNSEHAARQFITSSPPAYCNCTDATILNTVLNSYDQSTHDFFRWQVSLPHHEIADLLDKKLSLDLGRITALKPVKRGLSSRIEQLRIVGEKRAVIIGKELEIRRALSPTHLYSSAFTVDTLGPVERPDTFILTGAGWGHGVGLCQIGAAVMAFKGKNHQEILSHYYPESTLEHIYQ